MSIAIKLSNTGDAASTNEAYVFRGADRLLTKIVLVMLPIAASRHNSPARPHALTNATKSKKADEDTIVYLSPFEDSRAYAQILAAIRAFPSFSMKSADTARNVESKVHIVVEFPVKESSEVLSEYFAICSSSRSACRHSTPPAQPDDASICFLGKGIVYDTGGLSIKAPTTFMAGTKMDMGGSSAVLCATYR